MSKREQIILGIMAAVVVIGGIMMIADRRQKSSVSVDETVKIQELQTFVTDMTQKLNTNDLTDKDAYIIRKATSPWLRDPFSTEDLPNEADVKKAGAEKEITFSYTGYIQIGNSLIAVINGVEYGVGEELGEPGYVVESISSKKVIVKARNRKMIELPLEDTM